MLSFILGVLCLAWYIIIAVVCTTGYVQIFRYYRTRPVRSISESLPIDQVPHITVIRPVKGLEPSLYECLAATFLQTYPASKLTIRFCVSQRNDPAFPILEQVVADFPTFDAAILVEDEDPFLRSASGTGLGPNPKIRNMSRAYREAKGDLVWIIDCNVWVGKGVAGRMVDTLCGFKDDGEGKRYKFVHQLPLVVDITGELSHCNDGTPLDRADGTSDHQIASSSTSASKTVSRQQFAQSGPLSRFISLGGGRLEELFLSSSHAKFYTAINTVLLAPCIVGKSNMFRRSHLDSLTSQSHDTRPQGIDYFSHNICEDHLIGDLLWKGEFPDEMHLEPGSLGNHAMLFGDLAIQPMAGMSIGDYIARRVRWLRVRKFTVTLATLVEPGTESFLCSLYGAFAITTVPWFQAHVGIPPTWASFFIFWSLSVSIWAGVDWTLYLILHSMASVEVDENTPPFARGRKNENWRTFTEWLPAWLGREALALPIWTWAVYGGVTVNWRGRKFRVGMDMRVHALDAPVLSGSQKPFANGDGGSSKARRE